jgi:hypothetical protein
MTNITTESKSKHKKSPLPEDPCPPFGERPAAAVTTGEAGGGEGHGEN